MSVTVQAPARSSARLLNPDTLADSVVILLALTVLQRGVGFGRSVLFCRLLNPAELGEWDIAFGFLLLAAPVAVLSLPASFGRYVEYYRQRGQLRTFLMRTAWATCGLAAIAVTILNYNAAWFSQLVFGRPDRTLYIVLLSGTLLMVIAYNFISELFTALRLQRFASGLEFVNSLGFAVLGVGLLLFWQATAASVLVAFGGACLLSVLLAITLFLQSRRQVPRASRHLSQLELWGKLLPFIAWVWATNWLGNLFMLVDRYMIIHHSGRSPEEALALVGQYHSSRIVPLLLISVASLLGATIIPFLAHYWEGGRRKVVSRRLNLLLKLNGLGLLTGAVLVLLAAPLLFRVAFQGKYDDGLAVLCWTLMYSAWFGMICIAKAYLWCDEKVRLVSLSLLAGLLVNIGLNLILLPRLGLLGAALSTCGAHVVALLAVYAFASLRGMRVDSGTWLVSALPAMLCLSPWTALVLLLIVLTLAVRTNLLFDRAEKAQLLALADRYLGKLRRRLVRGEIGPVVD